MIPTAEIITSVVNEMILSVLDEVHGESCMHSRHATDASFKDNAEVMIERQKQNKYGIKKKGNARAEKGLSPSTM